MTRSRRGENMLAELQKIGLMGPHAKFEPDKSGWYVCGRLDLATGGTTGEEVPIDESTLALVTEMCADRGGSGGVRLMRRGDGARRLEVRFTAELPLANAF